MNRPRHSPLTIKQGIALLALSTCACLAQESPLIRALQSGDHPSAEQLIPQSKSGARDAQGNTPLHLTVIQRQVALSEQLIARGARVNATNNFGATPLHYAGAHAELVRLLLKHEAAVDAATRFRSTPLTIAARYPQSAAAVRLLLAHGADPTQPDGAGNSALDIAAQAGDLDTVEMLLDAGLKPGLLASPARYGHQAIVERFLAQGTSKINQNQGFAGHALNHALYGQQPEIAKLLIEHGADLTLRSPTGQHETPPMLWAAYNESGDASVAGAMLAHGADPNRASQLGETALDWAYARRNNALIDTLLAAGATRGRPPKTKSIPRNRVATTKPELETAARQAAAKGIALLQRASDGFLNSPLVRQQRCVSCHHQTLPAIAFGWALDRQVPLDRASVARQIQDQIRYWSRNDKIAKSYEMIRPQPDWPVLLGYGLLGLDALHQTPDTLTHAMTWFLLESQQANGSWPAADYRPPLEDGPIQGAALALRALQAYPPPGLSRAVQTAIDRAGDFLDRTPPTSFNQQVFQLLGLHWAGRTPQALRSKGEAIRAKQRNDGGWAPSDGLESDAWATGQALVALHLAGQLEMASPPFEQGLRFLLRTQFEDGSWFARSRSWPFQPHFETGFPHGKDQWSSAGATAWAVMALLLTQDAAPTSAAVDWQQTEAGKTATNNTRLVLNAIPASHQARFEQDIQPALDASCGHCHGAKAERKKGRFDLTNLAKLLEGGQSRQALILPGESERSPLIQLVTDQVEDLEMPPLSKRNRYPALSRATIAQLRTWIDTLVPVQD